MQIVHGILNTKDTKYSQRTQRDCSFVPFVPTLASFVLSPLC